MVEEAKEREFQMLNKVKAMEQQVQALTARDHEVSSALTHTTVFLLLIFLIVKISIQDSLKYIRLSVIKEETYRVVLLCLQNMKKQRLAEAAVDSMKQQMLELCRSDTLSKTRQQHDRDLTVMKEQHEAALLTLEQKLDSTSEALNKQVCSVTVTGDIVDSKSPANIVNSCVVVVLLLPG